MLKRPDHAFDRSRWVLCNKGDLKARDMRARFLACEVNTGDRHDSFYASTPPLEAKKLLFNRYAAERTRDKRPLRLGFLDVKKAFFKGIPRRKVCVNPSRELGIPSHLVAKQIKMKRREDLFAATPPPEATKLLFPFAVTEDRG